MPRRPYLLWMLMVLMSGWLVLVAFQASLDSLMILTTDGCGQILYPEKLMQIGLLAKILQGMLAVALIIGIAIPRAPWSAWVVVSVLVAGFLLATAVIAVLNADFLTRCDIFVLSPANTALLNIVTVAGLGVLGWRRHAQQNVASR